MRFPRDLIGGEPVKALRVLGYDMARQNGSHIVVTTRRDGEHHETIPNHRPLRIGTLRNILKNVAAHHRLEMAELFRLLDL